MKKRIIATTLASFLVFSLLVGCGGTSTTESTETSTTSANTEKSPDKSDDAFTFEVIVKSYQSSYWQAAVKGIDTKAAELGVKVNTTGPNAESDIADQVNMLNNAINNNPDGIGLAACDQDSVLDSLQTAMEKKIPVVLFDAGVQNAPEGSVYATIATDNYKAGATAAEHIYDVIKDKIANSTAPVRIGEVNQDATSESIISRGLGFIDKTIELAAADGKTVAVVGNDYYINNSKDKGDPATADIIIEVAVPAQTTVELCATEASNILNKNDTIAIFGSNQVSAEGLLTANQNLGVLGSDPSKNIIAAGFDAGSTIKSAVKDRTLFGAVTQSPLKMGETTIEVLTAIAKGESVSDVSTDGYWYDDKNIDDPSIAPNLYD